MSLSREYIESLESFEGKYLVCMFKEGKRILSYSWEFYSKIKKDSEALDSFFGNRSNFILVRGEDDAKVLTSFNSKELMLIKCRKIEDENYVTIFNIEYIDFANMLGGNFSNISIT